VRIVWFSSKGAARYLTGTSRPAFRRQNIACEVLAKMGLTITNLFPTKWPFLSAQERRAPVRFAEENEYTSWFVNYLADDVVPRIIETLPL